MDVNMENMEINKDILKESNKVDVSVNADLIEILDQDLVPITLGERDVLVHKDLTELQKTIQESDYILGLKKGYDGYDQSMPPSPEVYYAALDIWIHINHELFRQGYKLYQTDTGLSAVRDGSVDFDADGFLCNYNPEKAGLSAYFVYSDLSFRPTKELWRNNEFLDQFKDKLISEKIND